MPPVAFSKKSLPQFSHTKCSFTPGLSHDVGSTSAITLVKWSVAGFTVSFSSMATTSPAAVTLNKPPHNSHLEYAMLPRSSHVASFAGTSVNLCSCAGITSSAAVFSTSIVPSSTKSLPHSVHSLCALTPVDVQVAGTSSTSLYS